MSDQVNELTKFFDHIDATQDDLTILLRGHLYVEIGLVQLIRANLAQLAQTRGVG
jgi:hypothetical protein